MVLSGSSGQSFRHPRTIVPATPDMSSEAARQHIQSSRNNCPGMSERLSGAAGQNYKSIFIKLK